jgi:uncharacterized protein
MQTPGRKSGFPDAAARGSWRLSSRWRPLLRAIHRDIGYSAVGLTFVYALSGIAVNHIAQWDPNFRNTTTMHDVGTALPADDQEAARLVCAKLGVSELPREVYREGDEIEILFEHRTLHVNAPSGRVVDEQQQPRFFLRAANWLHLNRGKKAWVYFADSYAAGLLLLATSGLFMIPGRKGLVGRGFFFVAAGVAAPLVYLLVAHG